MRSWARDLPDSSDNRRRKPMRSIVLLLLAAAVSPGLVAVGRAQSLAAGPKP